MKSTSKKRTPNIVNLTVKRRYLTEREVDRLGSAHLVEMKAEPAALPAPGGQSPEKLSSKRKPNRLMIEVDTAVGPRERKAEEARGGRG